MNVKCFKRLRVGEVVKHHDINERDAVDYYMITGNDGITINLQSISTYHEIQIVLDEIEGNEELIEEITEFYTKERPVCLEPMYYIQLLGGVPWHQDSNV